MAFEKSLNILIFHFTMFILFDLIKDISVLEI